MNQKEFNYLYRKTGLTTKEFKEKYPFLYKEELASRKLEKQEKFRLKKERKEKLEKELKLGNKEKRIEKLDKLELAKIEKAIKEKKGDWLGKWLKRFSIEEDFWRKEKQLKIKNNDWL